MTGEAKTLAITETAQASLAPDTNAAGLIGSEMFESIYTPGKSLLLTSWKTPEDCARWTPRLPKVRANSAAFPWTS